MFESSQQHLRLSECTYWQHMTFAVKASGLLAWAAVASLIHSLWPGVLKGAAARVVIDLYTERLKDHPNPLYRKWIDGSGADN